MEKTYYLIFDKKTKYLFDIKLYEIKNELYDSLKISETEKKEIYSKMNEFDVRVLYKKINFIYKSDKKRNEIDLKRRELLSETDYLLAVDYPLSEKFNQEQIIILKQYRKDLRDICGVFDNSDDKENFEFNVIKPDFLK